MEFLRRKFEHDRIAAHFGMEITGAGVGWGEVRMEVAERHLNSVDTTHGGVLFSLADVAMAVAGNSHGIVSVAANASISFVKPARAGETLTARAQEIAQTRKTAAIRIDIVNEQGEVVALMQGTVFRTGEAIPGGPAADETPSS
jgi:acyl-CoA thioesterase